MTFLHPALILALGCALAVTAALAEPHLTDVSYLPSNRAEKLDVWLPAPAFPDPPYPAILLIHGGGWRIGDKADTRERSIAADLTTAGYAVFSINYLLNTSDRAPDGAIRHTRVAWPRNLEDCMAALDWIRTEGARRFLIDPARVAVMGCSAGGHLAMLVGAQRPESVRAIVNLYGIAQVDEYRHKAFAGNNQAETLVRAVAASPVTHFGPRTPPLFVAHGTADQTVPVKHSRDLAQELAAQNLVYIYVEIAGATHSFDLKLPQLDLRSTLFAFLKRHVAPAP